MTGDNKVWLVIPQFWPVIDRWPAVISSPDYVMRGMVAVVVVGWGSGGLDGEMFNTFYSSI